MNRVPDQKEIHSFAVGVETSARIRHSQVQDAPQRLLSGAAVPRKTGTLVQNAPLVSVLFVRSPFRAKHHVIVQYICQLDGNAPHPLPLPNPPPSAQTPPHGQTPPPQPEPPPLVDSMAGGRQGGQGRFDEQGTIHDITDAARDFALQLP